MCSFVDAAATLHNVVYDRFKGSHEKLGEEVNLDSPLSQNSYDAVVRPIMYIQSFLHTYLTMFEFLTLLSFVSRTIQASLLLLGSSLYSVDKHVDANRVFRESLAVIKKQVNACTNINIENRGKEKFTAGKVLNNIGCAFFELGYYKSACQAMHRALLVFMSNDLDCGYPDLEFDAKHGLPESFPSLTVIMNGLKTREIEIVNIPPQFEQDVAVTFGNLAFLLAKRKKFSAAAVCLVEAASVSLV